MPSMPLEGRLTFCIAPPQTVSETHCGSSAAWSCRFGPVQCPPSVLQFFFLAVHTTQYSILVSCAQKGILLGVPGRQCPQLSALFVTQPSICCFPAEHRTIPDTFCCMTTSTVIGAVCGRENEYRSYTSTPLPRKSKFSDVYQVYRVALVPAYM